MAFSAPSIIQNPIVLLFIISLLILVIFIIAYLLYKKNKELEKVKQESESKARDLNQKLYQEKVLDELTDRFGYSLNIEKVVDTIVASLDSLISYSVVSYILIKGNKLIFKSHLVESISRSYLEDVKHRMFASIKELTAEEVEKRHIEETQSGELLQEETENVYQVASFFNIPLVINGEVVGLFNVSSTKQGMFAEQAVTLLYEVVSKATNTVTKLQQLLGRERGKLESMVQNMTDGVLMIDRDFRILTINPACMSILEISKESNLNIFDIVGAFGKDFPIEETITKVFESGEIRALSEVHVGARYLRITIIPVEIEGGLGVSVLIQDQSKEQELKRLREDFQAMMIHELRSPLTVILGTSDFLIKQYGKLDKAEFSSFLDQIRKTSSDLLSIVSNLLDIAKIEAEKFEISKIPGDLNKLLKDELEYYANLATEKDIEVVMQLDDNIQSLPFDYPRLTQVMNNLLSNAIKYTDEGQVVVTSAVENNEIKISVTDSGRGIPDILKPKLFNKFAQFKSPMFSDQRGTGLGLVVAKGIIEAHGGKIWVEDNQPRGSKFIFTIPLP